MDKSMSLLGQSDTKGWPLKDLTPLPPEVMKEIVLNIKEPAVVKGAIEDWLLLNWNLQDWANAVRNIKLPFRIGTRKCTKSPQWEGTCATELFTLKEFKEMTELEQMEERDTWMYFDYKYMNEWFKDHLTILKSVSWKAFGFPDVQGENSTIWLGSRGAHTPCHADSYSVNLVAQLHGKKMWLLFPPERAQELRPTRVPYEESSVYSEINFYCKNSIRKLEEAYFVLLNPGDVLIVPNGWWHYVENMTSAISINTWIPLASDDERRLEECLIRGFIASTVQNLTTEEKQHLLNPNEMSAMENSKLSDTKLLSYCLSECKWRRKNKEANSKDERDEWKSFIESNDSVQRVEKVPIESILKLYPHKCQYLEDNVDLGKYKNAPNDSSPEKTGDTEKNSSVRSVLLDNVINAFCHPDVISKVKERLINERTTE